MTKAKLERVSTLTYKGRTRIICRASDGQFWAINPDWIDESGRLNRTVTGAQALASTTLPGVISRVRNAVDIAEIMDREHVGVMEAVGIWLSEQEGSGR